MALDDLTKQLVKQVAGSVKPAAPPAAPQAEPVPETIVKQVQAMQKALKEDEELVVLLSSGPETIRVLELFLPSWQVAVLSGIDKDKNVTRVVSPIERLQLICKVMKVAPPAKPARIGIITPKPR
jgi:hypothetical protein